MLLSRKTYDTRKIMPNKTLINLAFTIKQRAKQISAQKTNVAHKMNEA